MTYEDLHDLGWKYRYSGDAPIGEIYKQAEAFNIEEEHCRWIMSIYLDDGHYYTVMINYVDENVTFNEWENSETNFYGSVKTKEDLHTIMRFIHIIDYDSKL